MNLLYHTRMSDEPLLLLHSKTNVDSTYDLSSQFLKENPDILDEIHYHYWALHYVWDVIPQDGSTIFNSAHTFPATESESKFDAAIELALEGFYYESILVLKSCYELGLLSVFYNHDDNGPSNIEKWAKSQADTPFMRDVKHGMEKITSFIEFDKAFSLLTDLDSIYRLLNDYSHTKGLRFSSIGISKKSNVNHFNEAAFHNWWSIACAVSKTIVLVHAIRYPLAIKKLNLSSKFGIDIPFGYFLDDSHVDTVRRVLPGDRVKFIEQLLDKDEFSQVVIQDIASRPDMTDKELKQQGTEFSQMLIEHHPNGYIGWFEFHETLYKRAGKKAHKAFLEEARELEEWAKEKGVYSKEERGLNA